MMEKIGAWIRDPRNNFIKGQTKRSALYEIYCERPETCDLLKLASSCLHCGAMSPCKFGKKHCVEGPTTRARSFYPTLKKWKETNDKFIGRLKPLRAYNRIFKTHGHFYLPYSHMTKGGFGEDGPLESKWIPEAELTTELLSRICTAKPRSMFGGIIQSYQDDEIPKFISDLNIYYPEIFALLPVEQQERLKTISYVGRRADITTCAPGDFLISKTKWTWDGEFLRGKSMILQPVKGDIEIKIKPVAGESVVITDNTQVSTSTRFLD